MASLIYNSYHYDSYRGLIDSENDSFKAMLMTSSYTPDIEHATRDDLTNEVTGTGYTAGGATVDISVALDAANDKIVITVPEVVWADATITARYLAVYQANGGTADGDRLVCLVDFGADFTSTAGNFTAQESTIEIQN